MLLLNAVIIMGKFWIGRVLLRKHSAAVEFR